MLFFRPRFRAIWIDNRGCFIKYHHFQEFADKSFSDVLRVIVWFNVENISTMFEVL